jgi:hypothetical protein
MSNPRVQLPFEVDIATGAFAYLWTRVLPSGTQEVRRISGERGLQVTERSRTAAPPACTRPSVEAWRMTLSKNEKVGPESVRVRFWSLVVG